MYASSWPASSRRRFAIEYFVYRVALSAGMLAAALGGLDAFVFTAGVGENSSNDPPPGSGETRLARRRF